VPAENFFRYLKRILIQHQKQLPADALIGLSHTTKKNTQSYWQLHLLRVILIQFVNSFKFNIKYHFMAND
jgi:hypothetical protein